MKKILSNIKKRVNKSTGINIFIPYSRTEMKAIGFFVNHVGEQYGRGSFNLELYRKIVEIKFP
jgi:hypothetical protein